MIIQDGKEMDISMENLTLSDDIRTILFKESYLDNLVEAEALLEVVGKMVAHHDDVLMTSKAFMGLSILLEKITQLIDVNANLVDSRDMAANIPERCEAVT